jgi:MFS transporter, CP family, cyanate transporter
LPRITRAALLGLAIALVAANLRPAMASVGPVLADIRADLGLSAGLAALLTALPVACLGALSPSAPALARRWGMEPVLAVVLALIGAGLVVRVGGGVALLFAGTAAVSGAIAVANVLLPAVIKRDFPGGGGAMMGVYTMALSGSAAVAAGVTVPLERLVGHGWRGALAAWAVPAVVALLAWLPFARRHTAPPPPDGGTSLLRAPLAWQVTAFFGLQALCFYSVLSWLPSVYRELGYSPAAAGLVLSVATLIQIPVTLLVPSLATRAADQRWYAAGSTVLTAAGLAGVLAAPTAATYLWALLLGLGMGGTFAVALTLFVVRARSSRDTARLSAMAQTFGYLIAAGGPFLVGAIRDAAGSWAPALGLLLALMVPQLVAGWLSGRSRQLGRRELGQLERTN